MGVIGAVFGFIGKVLRRALLVSVATATVTVLMFVLDAVLLKDRDRRPIA